MMIAVAFLAGCIGALVGGTQVFVLYGIAGLFATALSFTSLDFTFFNEVFHNTFLLPAVIFNGNVLATAYASRKYDIKGWQITKSLTFTKDPLVICMGGIGAVIGYLMFTFFTWAKLPLDCGALTVMLAEMIFRLFFQKGKQYNEYHLHQLSKLGAKYWLYELVVAVVVAAASGYFVIQTGILMMPFYISAATLLLSFVDPAFPATHQISMVASYAAFYSGNLAIAVLFGVLGQLIMIGFSAGFNTDMKTHIDPPAVAIAICSLLIFTIFR